MWDILDQKTNLFHMSSKPKRSDYRRIALFMGRGCRLIVSRKVKNRNRATVRMTVWICRGDAWGYSHKAS